MKSRNLLTAAIILAILLFTFVQSSKAITPKAPAALSTAFSYQGYLKQSGQPANGAFDFQFRLYDALTGGTVIAGPISMDDLNVTNGYFTVGLDFGGSVYTAERWLDISVRPGAETGSYTTVAPRLALSPSPFALSAPWSGLTAVPAGFADNVDNDTLYTNGTGLDLNSNTFSVNTGVIQQRVSGACRVGSAIRQINADGTVVCEPHDTRPVFSRTQLASVSSANGRLATLAIGSDGLPLVAYLDGNQNMKVLHCLDLACTSAENHTISSSGLGWYISIAIGADGYPIMFTTNANWGAYVIHCSDLACSSSTITPLESCCVSGVRNSASIAIGVDGLALITYHRLTTLKTAHCTNLECTGFTTAILASGTGVDGLGEYGSLAIGVDGLGLIGFFDNYNDDSYVAHCSDIPCSTATFTIVDSNSVPGNGGRGITIGSDGLGILIIQKDGEIAVVHCANVPCTSSTLASLPALTGAQGVYTVVAIGSDGLPVIAFSDLQTLDIVVAHCADNACTASTYTSLSTTDDDSASPSLAIGMDGMPILAYINETDLKVEVMHCSNLLCIPFWQRP